MAGAVYIFVAFVLAIFSGSAGQAGLIFAILGIGFVITDELENIVKELKKK